MINMMKHLKPLYIKAHLNGKLFNRVFVDGGDVLNIMPLTTMKKLGKNADDLITTSMTMTSFMGHLSHALGVLVADVTVRSKGNTINLLCHRRKAIVCYNPRQ